MSLQLLLASRLLYFFKPLNTENCKNSCDYCLLKFVEKCQVVKVPLIRRSNNESRKKFQLKQSSEKQSLVLRLPPPPLLRLRIHTFNAGSGLDKHDFCKYYFSQWWKF